MPVNKNTSNKKNNDEEIPDEQEGTEEYKSTSGSGLGKLQYSRYFATGKNKI